MPLPQDVIEARSRLLSSLSPSPAPGQGRSSARPAHAGSHPILVHVSVCVVFCVLVALWTVCWPGFDRPAPVVLLQGHGLKMLRVDTCPVSTQVIRMKSIKGACSVNERIGPPMRCYKPPSNEHAGCYRIPIPGQVRPFPTPTIQYRAPGFDCSEVPHLPISMSGLALLLSNSGSRGCSNRAFAGLPSSSHVSVPLSRALSASAHLFSILHPDNGVGISEKMPALADGSSRNDSPREVRLCGYRLKVPRVTAGFVPAEMVEVERTVKLPAHGSIGQPVELRQYPIDRHLSRVSVLIEHAPLPAPRGSDIEAREYCRNIPYDSFPRHSSVGFRATSIGQKA